MARSEICDRCETRQAEFQVQLDCGEKLGLVRYVFCRQCVLAACASANARCATHACSGTVVRSIPVAMPGAPLPYRFGFCLECAELLGRALRWPHEAWPQP